MDVPRHDFDADHRAIAHNLDRSEPYWVIWWGTWTRRYFALPTWNAPYGLALHAPTPRDLIDQMRAAEDGRWVMTR